MIRMQTLAGLVAFPAAKLVAGFFAVASFVAALVITTAVLAADPASAQEIAPVPQADTCLVDGRTVTTVASAAECLALVSLYNDLGGPAWTTTTGWNTAVDPCTWHGIRCSLSGVTEVDLSWNGLSGELPAAIGDLGHLETLVLQGNDLSGPIPSSIGGLSALQFLALSDTSIRGELPSEIFALRELRLVAIEGANLSGGLSEDVGQLTKLNVLALAGNQLTGPLPEALAALDALLVLDLSDNDFDGAVPTGLANIEGIRQIRLDGNNFEPIPASVGSSRTSSDVSVAVSCLAGNGRVDVAIANTDAGAADYTVFVGALDGRGRTVAADSTEIVTVTGRADGPLAVVVAHGDLLIHDEQVMVDCDPEPTAPVAEVGVAVSCLAGNGRIDVTLANLDGLALDATAAGDYTVSIGELAPRSATVDAQSVEVVTATGRANGELPITVTRSGGVVHTSTVVVSCN